MDMFQIHRRDVIVGAILAAAGIRGAEAQAALSGAPIAEDLPNQGGMGPWDYWRSGAGSGVVRIASGAILSASPYNTQPWLFRFGTNRIEVLADAKKNLGDLDPYRREFFMGLGCSIETACVVAPSQGLAVRVSLLPVSADVHAAAIMDFSPAATTIHPHLDAIASRHTNRAPYLRDRGIEPAVRDALMRQASVPDVKLLLIDARGRGGQVYTDLVMEATQRILETPPLREGRHAALRETAAAGADISDAALERDDARWLEATRNVACATAAMFGLIMVRGNRADHRLHMEAGRLWQRVHLEATVHGLAMQPMSHHIEIIDREVLTQGTSSMSGRLELGNTWRGWEPIFGFRAGYAESIAPASPRRPLSGVVVS